MGIFSLGHLLYTNHKLTLTARISLGDSIIFLKNRNLKTAHWLKICKRNNMSGPMNSSFNTILGTSIKAANHAGKMVRDIMKTGDLSIVEKTGANDLQVKF